MVGTGQWDPLVLLHIAPSRTSLPERVLEGPLEHPVGHQLRAHNLGEWGDFRMWYTP